MKLAQQLYKEKGKAEAQKDIQGQIDVATKKLNAAKKAADINNLTSELTDLQTEMAALHTYP